VYATRSGDTEASKVAEENVVKNARDIAGAVALFYGKRLVTSSSTFLQDTTARSRNI
jgi:hypothetical protein